MTARRRAGVSFPACAPQLSRPWSGLEYMSCLVRAFRYSFSDGIPLRSGCVALVVGTILNLINQGDAILGG